MKLLLRVAPIAFAVALGLAAMRWWHPGERAERHGLREAEQGG